MHDKIVVSAQTLSMKDAERDEQTYQEIATLRDENIILKEQVKSLALQKEKSRTKNQQLVDFLRNSCDINHKLEEEDLLQS